MSLNITSLARDAGYDIREPSVWQIYLKGLPESVGTEVWRYPVPQTFPELVAKTLSVVKEKGTHNDIWGRSQRSWGNQHFQQDRTSGNRPSFSNNQRFNSSNAPRSFNDQPVDMDLSRTRANRKGQWTRGARAEDEESKVQLANLEAAEPKNKFKGICYNCYDSFPIYTYFLILLTYDAPPESPYSSGPPTGPLEPMDRLMPNPYPN